MIYEIWCKAGEGTPYRTGYQIDVHDTFDVVEREDMAKILQIPCEDILNFTEVPSLGDNPCVLVYTKTSQPMTAEAFRELVTTNDLIDMLDGGEEDTPRLSMEGKTFTYQFEGVERQATAVEEVKAICDIVARLGGYALTHGESCYHKHRYNRAQLYRLASARLDRAADELRAALDLLTHAEK